ncbi:MAG: uroporphyrinogen decarboxylase family protein [Moorellales bacterium]
MYPPNWSRLSAEQKCRARMEAWFQAEGVPFPDPQARQAYQERVRRLREAIELGRPDRVPIILLAGFFPAQYAGLTAQEAMYDYERLGEAMRKFNRDFTTDALVGGAAVGAGKVYEILDLKLYRWPGHGTPPDTPFQCVEKEYMREDEYDLLIRDPSDYWVRYYLPRIFGALEPWSRLLPVTDLMELPFMGPYLVMIGLPEVQEAFRRLLEAGRAAQEWIRAVGAVDTENSATLGLPRFSGGFTKAPFDTLGDTLRGTRGIMLDMYRRPEKLLAALEALVPLMIDMGVHTSRLGGSPCISIPIHKGADGFLSREAFAKFYWPSFKAVLLGLIEQGLVPFVFVEGSYNQRLDFLADPDLPKGRILWLFDQTDMVKAKAVLGGRACIAGNVPLALLKVGTPEQVRQYVRDLIEKVAGDGGFILANGGVLDDVKPENLRAMIEAGLEYGRY